MRGYFGIGIYHPKKEVNIGTLFRSASNLGAKFIYTVGRRYKTTSADTGKSSKHIPLFEYTTIDELVGNLPKGCPLIGVELDNKARDLANFCHPLQACYMLGAEDHGIPPEILNKCHFITQIGFSKGCLNVSVAGSIVMYDRILKQQKV